MGKIVRVGRASENDIVLKNDRKVSRYHFQIDELFPGVYELTDLNSTNGTFVNGRNIGKSCSLKRGDIIRIGDTVVPWMKYFVQDAPGGNFPDPKTAIRHPVEVPQENKSRKLGLVSFVISLVGTVVFGLGVFLIFSSFWTVISGVRLAIVSIVLHIAAEIFAGIADAIEEDEKDVNFAILTKIISGIQLGLVAFFLIWVYMGAASLR